jgi:hypothetical protein
MYLQMVKTMIPSNPKMPEKIFFKKFFPKCCLFQILYIFSVKFVHYQLTKLTFAYRAITSTLEKPKSSFY